MTVEYFMDSCTIWEIENILDCIPYCDRNLWETQRLSTYINAKAHFKGIKNAQDICKFVRDVLRELLGDVADEIRVLYGGSVKPVNVKEYLSCPDVDGALVGGASLKIDSYEELLKNIL